ncbi:SMP-30/gluconolactonase/LRE family protein [Azospirillum sp. YIM B02556]|uniref:SMP-30/gluconolactonase/LRE family protein n=1 Tax=Azospirillum endophyticum TaxID=2800326 RepID=A0ABS1FHD9_9PROT|nr:SMP-30/gluconolactonase/LRE family protein [Azospirillum endophyticum]MBK1842855.1 SMP-30/gluconolactonase/LRE family protein [Azospirillum endophyticum]
MTAVTTVGLDAVIDPALRNGTGENPVWDADRRRWTWIDIPARRIHRLDPSSGRRWAWTLPEMVGSLALRPDGGAVACCETGIFDVDLPETDAAAGETAAEAAVSRLAFIRFPKEGMRFNDGRCDRQGRLWVSSLVMDISLGDPSGAWFRFTRAGGLAETGLPGSIIPNGSAFSPDGRTFYASDSHRDVRMVWAWDYDPDSGTARDRRPFVDMRAMVGRPDGAAVDADGCYWICCLDEGCIKRFTPRGDLDRRIDVPMRKPTMCAFGGPGLRTMLVTSLSRGPADLAEDPHGGRVLMFEPGVQGLPEPRLTA